MNFSHHDASMIQIKLMTNSYDESDGKYVMMNRVNNISTTFVKEKDYHTQSTAGHLRPLGSVKVTFQISIFAT